MPTYDYICDACGKGFEKFQSMTEPAMKKCPKCGKAKLRRLIGSGAGIIFKGTGFYQTDYKSKPSGDSAKNAPSGGCGSGACKSDKPSDKKKKSGD